MKSKTKVLCGYQEKRPEEEGIEGAEDAHDDLKFKEGAEFLHEDDSYLNFDVEEAENENNPAFLFLAKVFDQEGGRGLHLNNMDVTLANQDLKPISARN